MGKKAATKARPKAQKASAKKAVGASKSTKAASSGKEASMAVKSKGKGGKKAAEAESQKPDLLRSATKLSGKGVLIRTKRSAAAVAAVPEVPVKTRQVNTTEKSKGENPITLHHRKPTKQEGDELRDLLVTRRKQLQGDVDGLEAEAFSDETQHVSSNHLADSSFEQYEQEFNLSMIENETEELKEIGRALEKIDRGTFGVCEACGIDISIERLRAMPYTRICIHCRNKFEQDGGGDVFGVHPERKV